jgi:NAD(P)-dependent dehydrogenase (short-subunit alcohol dehydrogenase family)
MTNHVEGKTIVITGAGGGFGKLTSEKAAALGAKIMCADIDAAAAEAVASAIRADGGIAKSAGVDVRDIGQMKGLATATVA